MRRKDREITDKTEILDILRRCDTIRIAMYGDQHPYVIPASFGFEVINEQPVIYFHCARQGRKMDLLKKNGSVCIEGDIFIQVEKTAHGITARYESIIGFGTCSFLEDWDEMIHGLKLLTEHYGYYDYPLDRCAGMDHLYVGKITVEEITGKRNLPGSMTPADRMAQHTK